MNGGLAMFTSKKQFKKNFTKLLEEKFSKSLAESSNLELYQTLGTLIRKKVSKQWIATNKYYQEHKEKQVYYFSMEFLLGRLLESNLLNSGVLQLCKESLEELGIDLENLFEEEHDAGLGNGGLGRLAACFLDSLASLELPGHGCGIRYKYGLFQQKMINGHQVELPDYWLKEDYVWEVRRPDKAVNVRFGGKVDVTYENDKLNFHHHSYETVVAVPYDVPIIGYHNHTVNTLRLFNAETNMSNFMNDQVQQTDYYSYLDYKRSVEQISEFLYPDDSYFEGKLLRLKQQYFLVSAGLQSIIRTYKDKYKLPLAQLPDKIAIQINDTHPSLVVPELMRILLDDEGLGWDDAWEITTKTVAYTNHTTLSEALEKWPIDIVQSLLPRIYMIIEEMNERFCQLIYFNHPDMRDKIDRLAIISYGQVHMAHLAIAGSFSVNGVAKIHTEILKNKEMKDFHTIFPEKFNNKTNGITHRRWLMNANPKLADLITSAIGDRWISSPDELRNLLPFAEDHAFQEQIDHVKFENKKKLAKVIYDSTGVVVDEQSIFDVHIKRLHGYKRQLLNIFHIIHLYDLLRENPQLDMTPRTFIFGAKAAPGYHFAKKVINLIATTAQMINNDPTINKKLKVIFLENYSVSLAEKIIPATDVSEQISTASKEASGTGNMKLMMNGALTIGTLDGANVEIKEAVGDDNIFIFGLTAEEVLNYYEHGGYFARDYYHHDDRIRKVLDKLVDGFFGKDEVDFKDIYYSILTNNDEYFVLKDFDSYAKTHELIEQTFNNRHNWLKKSITNIALSGAFSSDRTISEYANEIWRLRPVTIP